MINKKFPVTESFHEMKNFFKIDALKKQDYFEHFPEYINTLIPLTFLFLHENVSVPILNVIKKEQVAEAIFDPFFEKIYVVQNSNLHIRQFKEEGVSVIAPIILRITIIEEAVYQSCNSNYLECGVPISYDSEDQQFAKVPRMRYAEHGEVVQAIHNYHTDTTYALSNSHLEKRNIRDCAIIFYPDELMYCENKIPPKLVESGVIYSAENAKKIVDKFCEQSIFKNETKYDQILLTYDDEYQKTFVVLE